MRVLQTNRVGFYDAEKTLNSGWLTPSTSCGSGLKVLSLSISETIC